MRSPSEEFPLQRSTMVICKHARKSARRSAVRTVTIFVMTYRATLGHFMGGRCRFEPSCSQYMIDAVAKHGLCRGVWRGVKRIARCQPWSRGGYDPA